MQILVTNNYKSIEIQPTLSGEEKNCDMNETDIVHDLCVFFTFFDKIHFHPKF